MTQELFFEELIDNSDEATAGLKGRSIFITVDARGKFISIEDNGLGLEQRKILDMAKPGEHRDKTYQKYGTQIGHYGFGFNAAAWWYGSEFSIESRVDGAHAVNGLTCNKDELERTKQWKADLWNRIARPDERKCFTRVTVSGIPEDKFKQFNEMNGFDKEHGHPMLLQKLADVYYMHLANPVPEWFKRIDSIAALEMRPLKITFEIRDPSCLLNCHFRTDPKREGVARFELHGQDFCGEESAIHRIVNPFVPEGKKNEPLHLSFRFKNPGFNPEHTGIQSSVSSREEDIRMDLVFFYHPSESGRETNPKTSEGTFPTTETDYGLALHWPTLGRMLPAGELPNGKWNLDGSGLRAQPRHNRFPFMEPEASFGFPAWKIYPEKVTSKVFDRVRGIAFFSKGVAVTEHKVKLLDAEGFLWDLPNYFARRNLNRERQEQIGLFRAQLVVWSKLDVDFQMVKDTSIASQLFIKASEKKKLNPRLGHPDQPWEYDPLELPSRIEYPQVIVGGSTICSKWPHQGQHTKKEGDVVMICLKSGQKAKSETEYGRVELLFCETERGECMPSGEGMLWKQITFREEEVKLVYFKDLKSLEKASKSDFKKYREGQNAKQKANRLEFSNECVINEKAWIPKATGDSYSTNEVDHVVIAVQAFCSDDGAKRRGTQRQPLKDPFLGAKLEITRKSQNGTFSAVTDDDSSRVLYGHAQSNPKLYQWKLSSKLFSTAGEYLISVTAMDHSDIKITTVTPAKLKITPGRPTTAIASWVDTGAHIAAAAPVARGRSSNGSPDGIKLIRCGNGFPSISVIFSDTTGNEVSCPSVDRVEVSIDCSTRGVTFLLKNVKSKSEKGRLLISADFLELTSGALEEISSIGVLVKVFSLKQELKATLEARVTTGPPEKLVLVWQGEPPDFSSIDPEVGLPQLRLQLRDAQDHRCILSSSDSILVKYATRNGERLSDYVELSSGYDQGEQLEPDEDDEDKQNPAISLDGLPFGARNCGVLFQAFKLSGGKFAPLLSTSRKPVCCELPPFTVASRSLCLDLDYTREQLPEDVEVRTDSRAASCLVSDGQSSHGEVTFSTNSGTKIEVRLFVVKSNGELASTMSAELGIRYEDAEGKALPTSLHLGPAAASLKEGKASFVLDAMSVSDSTMTAFCIITCSRIDEEPTRDRLKFRLEIKPPKKAPHTLQVLNLSTVSDGQLVPAFDVHVRDFDGLPSCKSASGEKLEVRVKASPLSSGDVQDGEYEDSCIVSGTCETRVNKEGVATFSGLVISRRTDPLQSELGTQNCDAAVCFSLYNHKSLPARKIESVRMVKCAVTIKPNLLPAKMELRHSRQGYKVLKKSDTEFEMNAYAGEHIDGLQVLILSHGLSPIELTALHSPQAFTLSCSETDAPPAPVSSDSIDWVDRDDLSLQLPRLSVPTTASTRHLALSLNGDAPLIIKLFLVVSPNLTDPSKLFWCISSKQNLEGALILGMGENWRPKIKVQVEDLYGNKAELSELPSKIAENAIQLQEVTSDKQLPSDFFSGSVRDTKVNAVTSSSYKEPAPRKSKHDAMSVKLVAGAPHVLNVSPAEMTVIHCSQLPTITLTVADAYGNTCKDAPYMAVLEAEQEFKRLLDKLLAEPLIVMMTEGSAVFQPKQELRLKNGFPAADSDQSSATGSASGKASANLEGKLLVSVTMNRKQGPSAPESICKLSPRTINVTVRRGKHPAKLAICSGGNQRKVVCSGPLSLESLVLKVIAEDGSDYAADDDLAQQARLDFQGLGKFCPVAVEGHLTFVSPRLKNIGKKLEQVGELQGKVYLQDIAPAHLIATLVAAKAAKLVYKGESELPKMLDCTQPLVLPKAAKFEVQDEFGNPATLPYKSNLTLKSSFRGATTSSVEGLQPVTLCGSCAVLRYDVKLITTGDSKAKSGSYQLLLQARHHRLPS